MINKLHISWNRIAILFLCAFAFFPWNDDSLYSIGWVIFSLLIAIRLISGALSKVSVFALLLLIIALLFGDWNHDALRYIGVILVLFISPNNTDELDVLKNDFKFYLICTYLFGIGIWLGVGFDWITSGLLELHCSTWLILIAFCLLNTKPYDSWKVNILLFVFLLTCVVVTAWSSFIACIVLLLWHFTRGFWSDRRLRILSVIYGAIVISMIFIAHNYISFLNEDKYDIRPFEEEVLYDNHSINERLILWKWTLSNFTGKVNGAGTWRQDVQSANLFHGKRQPRRAHNEWFHISYELGWVGIVLLLLFCIVRPWSALIMAPIFLLWFPMERPDFILALAILHSSPKSTGSFNSKFHFNSIWKPIKVSTSLLIPLFAFWILNWSLASWSLKIQSQISKNIIVNHSLPELKTIDLFALELFPENIRYGSDGWLRLGQYYLLKEDPCMALYWFDKRESRGFAKSKNLEYKARTDCTSIEDN